MSEAEETEITQKQLEQLKKRALMTPAENLGNTSDIPADSVGVKLRTTRHKQKNIRQQNEELLQERAELKQSLKDYKTYFDFAPTANYVIGDNGEIIRVNFRGAELLNVSRLWLSGNKFISYISKESLNKYTQMINRAYLHLSAECKNVKLNTDTDATLEVDIIAENLSADKTGEENYLLTVLNRDGSESELIKLREESHQLEKMSLHMQNIREEERSEVSKFVHDELGQTMTALKMNLVSLQGLIDKKNHKADQRIKESISMVNSGLSAVHNLTGRLTPGIIQDLGLIPALEYEIEEFRQWSKLECELRTDIEDIGLEKDAATDIFRIIRELLTNAARHSEGTAVFIYMKIQDDLLHVRVRDNGKGASPGDLNAGDSFGIMNVKGRVRKNGGNIIFDTELSKGFEVRISFPLIEITK